MIRISTIMKGEHSTKVVRNIFTGFLLVFGIITIKAGGTALYGTMTGTISGNFWLPVIALNTAIGFLYAGLAVSLYLKLSLSRIISLAVFLLALLSAALFFRYLWMGGLYETKTVYAILFRFVVASIAIVGVYRLEAVRTDQR